MNLSNVNYVLCRFFTMSRLLMAKIPPRSKRFPPKLTILVSAAIINYILPYVKS